MIGLEFVRDRATREPDGAVCETMIQGCADEGLLVISCGVEHNVIRWIAPLNVTSAEIGEALGIFGSVLRSVPAQPEAGTI
jgi:4-aminobutyrate aminotransferase-like enzyme